MESKSRWFNQLPLGGRTRLNKSKKKGQVESKITAHRDHACGHRWVSGPQTTVSSWTPASSLPWRSHMSPPLRKHTVSRMEGKHLHWEHHTPHLLLRGWPGKPDSVLSVYRPLQHVQCSNMGRGFVSWADKRRGESSPSDTASGKAQAIADGGLGVRAGVNFGISDPWFLNR